MIFLRTCKPYTLWPRPHSMERSTEHASEHATERGTEHQGDDPETAPPTASLDEESATLRMCDELVADDDINKHVALRLQRLFHKMHLASVRAKQNALREVEASRNELALLRLSPARGRTPVLRTRVAEAEGILSAQQETVDSIVKRRGTRKPSQTRRR